MNKYFIDVYLNYKRNWSLRIVEKSDNDTLISVAWLASFQSTELLNIELSFYDFPKLSQEDIEKRNEAKMIDAVRRYKISKHRAAVLLKTGWELTGPS